MIHSFSFRTAHLIGCSLLAFFNFFPLSVLAQCSQAGCSSQPSFTPPTSAQELVNEFRKLSSPFPYIQDFQQPVVFRQTNSPIPSAATVLSATSVSQASMRTWSNGEGQWKSLSNGSACLVTSSYKSSPSSAAPCADSF